MIVKIIDNGWCNNSESLNYYNIDKLTTAEISDDIKESEYSRTAINLFCAESEPHDTPCGPYVGFVSVDHIHLKNTQLVFIMNDEGKTIDIIKPLKCDNEYRENTEKNNI